MTQPGMFSPYSTIPWQTTPPSWVPPVDQARVQSYGVYDELYWSHINTAYKVMSRDQSSDDLPIYVPSTRIIIDAVNRYVGKGMWFATDPNSGSPASRKLAEDTITALFRRERFKMRYAANKRYGLIRGDWLWHIIADPAKPQGSRLSIMPVDPASYFPVFESDRVPGGSPDKIVAVYLADRVLVGDKYLVYRQRYEKVVNPNGTITIWTELSVFEEDKWFPTANEKAQQVITPLTALPPDITAIPVYHVPHLYEPGNPFGSSELRGLETIAAAVNQSVTDEDLALALMGLGVYATDQPGSPIDPTTGERRDWFIYPGAVIENSKGLRKVEGITNVSAYDSHIGRLFGYLQQATGAVPATMGRVDVQVAESGVALTLELAPMLAKAEEQDDVIADVHNQMLYDLRAWLKAYEGVNIDDVTLMATFADKLPQNRKAEVELVTALMSTTPPILSAQTAREYLAAKGFTFAEDEDQRVMTEQQAAAAASMAGDPFAARAGQEGGAGADAIGSQADAAGSTGQEG